MRRILRGKATGARAPLGALLVIPFILTGCGLDWNLGLWEPPLEETANLADTRIGSASGLTEAWGVAVRDGFVYVTDPLASKLYKLDQSKAGDAAEKVLSVGSPGTGELQFSDPAGVALDSAGNIHIADFGNHRVQKLTPAGVFSKEIGAGILSNPVGAAVDSINRLYVTDETLDSVFVFDSAGNPSTAWNGTGAFNNPAGIAVGLLNLQDHIYVVDWGNYQVKVFQPDGTFAFAFGSQGTGDGQFAAPWGIAVDSAGRIYVSDLTLNRVQQFDASGTFLAKLTTPADGRGVLREPAGLAIASSYLYVAENGAKWVRAIPLTEF